MLRKQDPDGYAASRRSLAETACRFIVATERYSRRERGESDPVTTAVAPSPVTRMLPTPSSTAGRPEYPLRLRDVVSKVGVDVEGT